MRRFSYLIETTGTHLGYATTYYDDNHEEITNADKEYIIGELKDFMRDKGIDYTPTIERGRTIFNSSAYYDITRYRHFITFTLPANIEDRLYEKGVIR